MGYAVLFVAMLGVVSPTDAAQGKITAGVVTQAPLTAGEFRRMDRGGVETLRFLVRWRMVEPEQGSYDWSSIDSIVLGAARADVELLPFVYGSPSWVADAESRPPIDSPSEVQAWQRFLGALVDRYGRGGALWSGVADPLPVTRWQIWNEPNFDFYWHPQPAPAEYAELLDISAQAVRSQDRRAKIVMAGLAPVASGIPWWRFLRRLYRVPEIQRDFDVAALHPYSPTIRDLAAQVRRQRRIMSSNGDRAKPLAITEIGWSSGRERAPLVVGAARQASLLRRSIELLRTSAQWRISDFQWYAWQDSLLVEEACQFCERAGLFDRHGRAKRAWRVYRRKAG